MKEWSPVPKPAARPPKTKSGLKRGKPLRRRSKSPAARRREDELAAAMIEAREYWGPGCIVPGCPRPGSHMHHAYGRGSHADRRADPANLIPLCSGECGHHRLAGLPYHWLYAACREIADEVQAHSAGRRPRVTQGEAVEICRRHRELAEPYVSPVGAAD